MTIGLGRPELPFAGEYETLLALKTIGAVAQHTGVSADMVNELIDPDAIPVLVALVAAERQQAEDETKRDAERPRR